MAITFNGSGLTIVMSATETVVSVADVYSRWKDWVSIGDNAKYPEAFSVVGGDAISATTNLAVNFFIRNDLGWRIRPPETDIDIVFVGNLYPYDPNLSWRTPPLTDVQTSLNTETSVNAIVVQTSGGGGGTSPFISGQFYP